MSFRLYGARLTLLGEIMEKEKGMQADFMSRMMAKNLGNFEKLVNASDPDMAQMTSIAEVFNDYCSEGVFSRDDFVHYCEHVFRVFSEPSYVSNV